MAYRWWFRLDRGWRTFLAVLFVVLLAGKQWRSLRVTVLLASVAAWAILVVKFGIVSLLVVVFGLPLRPVVVLLRFWRISCMLLEMLLPGHYVVALVLPLELLLQVRIVTIWGWRILPLHDGLSYVSIVIGKIIVGTSSIALVVASIIEPCGKVTISCAQVLLLNFG